VDRAASGIAHTSPSSIGHTERIFWVPCIGLSAMAALTALGMAGHIVASFAVALALGIEFERRQSLFTPRKVFVTSALLAAGHSMGRVYFVVSSLWACAWFGLGRHMVCVGLTGGIATGKSTVTKILRTQEGLVVIDVDEAAARIRQKGRWGYRAILAAFGPNILAHDGTIDSQKLARTVFDDASARKRLEKAVRYPLGFELLVCVMRARFTYGRLCVLDAPLLYETPLHKLCYPVVVVYCDLDQQVERLMARGSAGDGSSAVKLSAVEAQQRINAQYSLTSKIQRADICIDNTGHPMNLPSHVAEATAECFRLLRIVRKGRVPALHKQLSGSSTSSSQSQRDD
jgi:dephospho-CoA kinase